MEQLVVVLMVGSVALGFVVGLGYSIRKAIRERREERIEEISRLIMASSGGRYSSLSEIRGN